MSTHQLRWMARAWIVMTCVLIPFIVGGLVIELLAGIGLTTRTDEMWIIFHPGLAIHLAIFGVATLVIVLSPSAHRALRRRETTPAAPIPTQDSPSPSST